MGLLTRDEYLYQPSFVSYYISVNYYSFDVILCKLKGKASVITTVFSIIFQIGEFSNDFLHARFQSKPQTLDKSWVV